VLQPDTGLRASGAAVADLILAASDPWFFRDRRRSPDAQTRGLGRNPALARNAGALRSIVPFRISAIQLEGAAMITLRVARHLVLPASLVAFGVLADDNADPHAGHDGIAESSSSSSLVDLVRRETAQYRDVQEALDAGYEPGPCVSGPQGGAMGIHYVNGSLLGDGLIDPARPEALIYEPQRNGRLRLVGVEYITFAEFWPDPDRPVLAGHLLNYVGAPNRYGIPAFFEIHVWAWRENPDGTFSDWNPLVSCDAQPVEP
jgi:hypothetical protein